MKKVLQKRLSLFIIGLLTVGLGLMVSLPTAKAAATVTAATGGTNISIDTTSSAGGSHSVTALTGPVITESAAGEIATGIHTLTLPAGWNFDTTSVVTLSTTNGTTLAFANNQVTPGATTLSFNVTVASNNPEIMTFSGIKVHPTGTAVSGPLNITMTAGTITGVDGSTNFGSLTTVSGTATKIKVETEAGGGGSVVGDTSVTSGDHIHAYSITRDQFDNFVANAASDSWSLTSKTGGIVDGDLVPAGDSKSVTLTGVLAGSAKIHAAKSGLTSTDSGTITVGHGTVATLSVNQAPAITGTVDDIFSTQPWILVADAAGNPVDGETVTASIKGGTGAGTLRTTLTAVTGADGLAKFTDLGYDKLDMFTLHFADGGVAVDSAGMGPLTAGAAATLTLSQAPVGGNAATAVLTTQPVVHVVDQYGNHVVDGTTVTASKQTGAGTLRTTLTATTSAGLAAFADLAYNKLDNFTIRFTANGHTVDSDALTVIAGAATKVNVETAANGSGSVVAAQDVVSGAHIDVYGVTRDIYDNYVGNPADTVWTLTSKTGGVVDGDLTGSPAGTVAFTGALVGSATIHAVNGALTAGDSGTITVTVGATDHLAVTQEPTSTGTVDVVFTTQPIVVVHDAASNPVSGVDVVVTKDAGTCQGDLRGTTTVTSDASGLATFTNLGYSKSGDADCFLTFTGATKTVNSAAIGSLAVGAVQNLHLTTPPTVHADVDSVFDAQPVITVHDQYENVVSGAVVTAAVGTQGTADQLRGTLTATSDGSGVATFTNLGYNKINAFKVKFSATGAADVETDSLGPILAGAATKVNVETAVDGSGSVVAAQDVVSGAHIDVYGITRDQFNNFVANPADTVWTLTSKTGGVVDGDLTGSPAGTVAFTGALVGSATIHAVNGALTAGDSGTITVTVGATDHIVVTQEPASTGTVDAVFTTQPIVVVHDAASNAVSGVDVVVTKDAGTCQGDLRGTTTVTSDASGLATFTNLGYSLAGDADCFLTFTGATKTDDSAAIGSLNPGAAATLTLSQAPVGGNAATAVLTTQPIVHVVDQYGNHVANGVTVTASLASGAGTLRTTLTAVTASGEATFTDLAYNKLDNFTINFAANGHSITSDALSVIAGAATKINVETAANGSGVIVPEQSVVAGNHIHVYGVTRDTYDNFVANPADTTWSLTDKTGVVDGDLVSAGDGSAAFTAALVGSAKIHAANGALTAGDSGTITVVVGVTDHLAMDTQPSSVATVDDILSVQPKVIAHDIASNPVAGVTITATKDSGTCQGDLRGTVTAVTNASGLASFTNLGYSLAGDADCFLTFTGATKTVNSAAIGSLNAGALNHIELTTPPTVHADVDSVFDAQPVITAHDQYSNGVASVVITAAIGSAGTTGQLRGTLTATTNASGVATFTNLGYNKVNAFKIKFSATGASDVETNSLGALSPGAATSFTVTPSDLTPTTAETIDVTTTAYDQYSNLATGFTGIVFLTTDATIPYTWYGNPMNIITGGTATSSIRFQVAESGKTITAQNSGATVTGSSASITISSPTAPTVTAQAPLDNATSTAITVTPTLTFSAAMDASTLNGGTIQLRKYTDDSAVSATISYNPSTHVVTLTPSANLSNSTQYYLWVSGAKDALGTTVTDYVTKASQEFTTVAAGTGALGVVSTTMVNSTGTADDSYTNGWEWKVRVTLPTDHTGFAMKFTNWASGSNALAAGSNMQYYSDQIAAGTGSAASPISITAANTYPSNVTITTDADPTLDGIQTDIHVQVKLPTTTQAGSYSTSYGVRAQ